MQNNAEVVRRNAEASPDVGTVEVLQHLKVNGSPLHGRKKSDAIVYGTVDLRGREDRLGVFAHRDVRVLRVDGRPLCRAPARLCRFATKNAKEECPDPGASLKTWDDLKERDPHTLRDLLGIRSRETETSRRTL